MPFRSFHVPSRNFSSNNSPESGIYSILTILGIALFVVIYVQRRKRKYNFKNELFLLAAYVIKSDGNIGQKELNYVYHFFKKNFEKSNFFANKQKFDTLLSKNINISRALNKINRVQRHATKLQLLHFLVRITIVDSYLKNSEYIALQKIAKGLNISKKQLDAIFAMHDNYITENQHKNQSKQHQNRKQTSIFNKIKQAYSILELTESATEQEIKKAYRKLVVLYHPDKLLHLDETFQKGAKENYQKVNDAYEYIKTKRGF